VAPASEAGVARVRGVSVKKDFGGMGGSRWLKEKGTTQKGVFGGRGKVLGRAECEPGPKKRASPGALHLASVTGCNSTESERRRGEKDVLKSKKLAWENVELFDQKTGLRDRESLVRQRKGRAQEMLSARYGAPRDLGVRERHPDRELHDS